MAVWYKVNFYARNKQDRKLVIHLHLAPTIWVIMSQRDQLLLSPRVLCRLEKKPFSRSPEPRGSGIFSGLGVIGGFIFCMERDFYYCTAVSSAKTGSLRFVFYLSFVLCQYICIAYWLLPYFVCDSSILYKQILH